MSALQPSHTRAVTGTLRAGHAPPLRCRYTLLHIRPGGQLAGVDALDLVNGQVVGGVAGVDDDGDAIQRQDGSLGAALDLGVLQLTAGHADGVGALQRARDAGGGIGGLELQLGAAQTIDRIIDVCPAGAQNQIRGQLAAVLRGVITQQLLPLAVGKGRCAATEILVGTDAVANLIREGKCYQIPSILQSGAALGMHSLNADLARLVSTGRITREAAERCATNKSDLKNYL